MIPPLRQAKFTEKVDAAFWSWYTSDMDKKFHPVVSVRIFGEQKCFGPGVAELLRRVRECKSLRAASIAMGMAYSKAWTIVKNAESELGCKLLVSSTGGKNGGGAVLSPEAEQILAAYEEYCAALRQFAQEEFSRLFSNIL